MLASLHRTKDYHAAVSGYWKEHGCVSMVPFQYTKLYLLQKLFGLSLNLGCYKLLFDLCQRQAHRARKADLKTLACSLTCFKSKNTVQLPPL